MPDVVLPVLDEVDALSGVLAALPSGFDPIVVDNGSTDGSGDLARSLGVRVVVEPQRGFGAACWAGLHAARDDVVCFMDCDGSFTGSDLERVAAPLVADEADLVLGRRIPDVGAWPRHARWANAALARYLRAVSGAPLHDLGPMRAARRLELSALGIRDRRFGWPLEMVLRASRAGWRIREVDVRYRPRVGRSKVTGTLVGSARAAVDMTRVAVTS